MVNSRAKGKAGELELAKELERVLGVSARRGVQFHGGPDSPDIVLGIPGIHVECKRTESLPLYKSLDQSTRDAAPNDVPLVVHRANKRPWVVIVKLDDLPKLVQRLAKGTANEPNSAQPHG